MQKINVLVVAGWFCTEHHNGRENIEMLRKMMEATGYFTVHVMEEFRGVTDETLADYDVIMLDYEGRDALTDPSRRFGESSEQALYRFVSGGKGLLLYHGTLWIDPEWPEEFKKMAGGWFKMRYGRRNPNGDFELHRAAEDPTGITRYMPEKWYTVEDDMFAGVTWEPDTDTGVLCTAYDDVENYKVPWFPPLHHPVDIPDGDLNKMPDVNQENPQAWVNRYGKGRTVSIALGHCDGTIKRPGFMTLFLRGMEWAATGKATIRPADRSGEKRLIPWPWYDVEKNPAGFDED